jgi:signal transduction histidine kinase
MPLNMTVAQKGLFLVAVPLVCELFFVFVLVTLHRQAEAEVQRDVTSKTIIEHADVLMIDILNSGTATSTYALNIHKDKATAMRAFDQYGVIDRQILDEFETLKKLVKDKPQENGQLESIRETYDRYKEVGKEGVDLFNKKDTMPPLEFNVKLFGSIHRINAYLKEISSQMNDFLATAKMVEIESPQAQQRNRSLIENFLFAGIAFNIALAVALALWFSRDIASRLKVINENTLQLAKGKPLNPLVPGIDEIANVDKVFHEMADKLKEADRLKKEFVGIISHELRTPLTSIQALLTLLDAGVLGDLPDKSKKRIRGAEADVERLIRLIGELLDIEKMESGRLDMLFAEVKLDNVISRAVSSVRMIAEKRELSITYPESDEMLVADGDRLVQVLVNLMSNSIKFSPQGSSIDITLASRLNEIEFRVTDHGRGIPEEFRTSIFDRYKQVEIGDSKQKGGTGLGLAICKAIVEQHGGTIGVDSKMNVGSTFWFRIPRSVEPTPRQAEPHQEIRAK